MWKLLALSTALTVTAHSRTAAADYRDDLEEIGRRLHATPAARGVDRAPVIAPGWCPPPTDPPRHAGFSINLDSYYGAPDTKLYALVNAAGALCRNDPRAPVIQRATQEVLQIWMNTFGLSAPDAAESLALTLDKTGQDAAKQQLCAALATDDEVGGADDAFMRARRELFDCGGDTIRVLGGVASPMIKLVPWLDSSPTGPDELVRLHFVAQDLFAFEKARDERRDIMMLAYALDQFDMRAFDPRKALALADTPPYRGNAYARVTIKETIGQARLARLRFEDALAQRVRDPDWKEILVTAPQRGYAAWIEGAAKYQAELQRSVEFEQRAFGPSRKAIAGCETTLRADLAGVMKPFKRETTVELIAEMNRSPVAGLLFRRYQTCIAARDGGAASAMAKLTGIRVVRGPRAAAYYATLDAIGRIRADRKKFAITESDVPFAWKDVLEPLADELGDHSGSYGLSRGQGVIQSMKKRADGVLVTFAKDIKDVWSQSCRSTDRVIMIDPQGHVIYDRICTGKIVKADVSPDPILVPPHLVDGLAPKRNVAFGISDRQRVAMPFEIYANKAGTHLVNFYGIPLP